MPKRKNNPDEKLGILIGKVDMIIKKLDGLPCEEHTKAIAKIQGETGISNKIKFALISSITAIVVYIIIHFLKLWNVSGWKRAKSNSTILKGKKAVDSAPNFEVSEMNYQRSPEASAMGEVT